MKELISALVSAKKHIKPIKKSATNPFYKSAYAPLETVLEEVEPILLDFGLVIVQTTNATSLVTTLYHTSGQSISGEYPLPQGLDSQKLGAAITYARRYAISALLSLATEDDNDGNETVAAKGGVREKPQKSAAIFKAVDVEDIF